MVKKARLGLYLEDEELKKQIKIAAAKRSISTTAYCTQAIKEKLTRDGEISSDAEKQAFIDRVERLRKEIGPLGMTASELIKEGRRR